jgi:16S rRNA (adenine1518-N6/adenine1519-N6)-dimethyltransferase
MVAWSEGPDESVAASASAGPRLLGPADVRSLAESLGLRPTKQRGQNFVIDPNTVRRIVRAAALSDGETVLEVGPGLGSLTLALLAEGHAVRAVEIDPLLAEALPATIASYAPSQADRFSVVLADAMTVTAEQLGSPTACVANLPYNVAVPVLLHLLAIAPSIRHGLVMVQSEVADRLAAPPGSKTYGVPSAKGAWYADVQRAGPVGRNVFWPAPNVDSGLVSFVRRDPPPTKASREQVFAVVDAAFSQRRKTLRSALARWLPDRDRLDAVLAAAEVDPGARGEVLGIADFARIAGAAVSAPRLSACAPLRSGLRPRSTWPCRSGRRGGTGSTRSRPSTRRSRCTTT